MAAETSAVVIGQEFCNLLVNHLIKEEYVAVHFLLDNTKSNGKLSLILIGTSKEELYLIDILKGGQSLIPILNKLFKSDVIKVIHDVKGQLKALGQVGFTLYNVFDTQIAHTKAQMSSKKSISGSKGVSFNLHDLKKLYSIDTGCWVEDPLPYLSDALYWKNRPLTLEVVTHAEDILFVILYLKCYIKVENVISLIDEVNASIKPITSGTKSLIACDEYYSVITSMDQLLNIVEVKSNQDVTSAINEINMLSKTCSDNIGISFSMEHDKIVYFHIATANAKGFMVDLSMSKIEVVEAIKKLLFKSNLSKVVFDLKLSLSLIKKHFGDVKPLNISEIEEQFRSMDSKSQMLITAHRTRIDVIDKLKKYWADDNNNLEKKFYLASEAVLNFKMKQAETRSTPQSVNSSILNDLQPKTASTQALDTTSQEKPTSSSDPTLSCNMEKSSLSISEGKSARVLDKPSPSRPKAKVVTKSLYEIAFPTLQEAMSIASSDQLDGEPIHKNSSKNNSSNSHEENNSIEAHQNSALESVNSLREKIVQMCIKEVVDEGKLSSPTLDTILSDQSNSHKTLPVFESIREQALREQGLGLQQLNKLNDACGTVKNGVEEIVKTKSATPTSAEEPTAMEAAIVSSPKKSKKWPNLKVKLENGKQADMLVDIINSKSRSIEVGTLLMTEKFVGIGVQVGISKRNNVPRIVILQAATPKGQVYIFDLLNPDQGAQHGVQMIMEAKNLIKVIERKSCDLVALSTQFKMKYFNVTDIDELTGNTQSLQQWFSSRYSNNREYQDKEKTHATDFWVKRPFSPEMKFYACIEVFGLVLLYANFRNPEDQSSLNNKENINSTTRLPSVANTSWSSVLSGSLSQSFPNTAAADEKPGVTKQEQIEHSPSSSSYLSAQSDVSSNRPDSRSSVLSKSSNTSRSSSSSHRKGITKINLDCLKGFIQSKKASIKVANALQTKPFVAVSCQAVTGSNVLVAPGLFTKTLLIQIGTPEGEVYLFDALFEEVLVGIEQIMQEKNTIKVMLDPPSTLDLFHKEFGILYRNVINIRDLPSSGSYKKDLQAMCEAKGFYMSFIDKDTTWSTGYWERRPITREMMFYACNEVIAIAKLYSLRVASSQDTKIIPTATDGKKGDSGKLGEVTPNVQTSKENVKSSSQSQKCLSNSGKVLPTKIQVVLKSPKNLSIIKAKKEATDLCTKLIERETMISVGWKAYNSRASIILVSTAEGVVYIFDMASTIVIDSIREVLRSGKILKIVHDLSSVKSLFQKEYSIIVSPTFDTKDRSGLSNLTKLGEQFGFCRTQTTKVSGTQYFARPIPKSLQEEGAIDVLLLLKLYSEFGMPRSEPPPLEAVTNGSCLSNLQISSHSQSQPSLAKTASSINISQEESNQSLSASANDLSTIQNLTVVKNSDECIYVLDEFLREKCVLINIGVSKGAVVTVQVGIESGHVYVFDMNLPNNVRTVRIFFDVYSGTKVLYSLEETDEKLRLQHDINLKNVFDMKNAYSSIIAFHVFRTESTDLTSTKQLLTIKWSEFIKFIENSTNNDSDGKSNIFYSLCTRALAYNSHLQTLYPLLKNGIDRNPFYIFSQNPDLYDSIITDETLEDPIVSSILERSIIVNEKDECMKLLEKLLAQKYLVIGCGYSAIIRIGIPGHVYFFDVIEEYYLRAIRILLCNFQGIKVVRDGTIAQKCGFNVGTVFEFDLNVKSIDKSKDPKLKEAVENYEELQKLLQINWDNGVSMNLTTQFFGAMELLTILKIFPAFLNGTESSIKLDHNLN